MRIIQKKICLLGDISVGKTSLVRQFVEGRFDDKYLSTIGVTVSRKILKFQDYQLNLILWDLAGGDAYAKIQPSYLQGASGGLVVFDLTRPETLESVPNFVDELHATHRDAAVVLVGNKVDLIDQRRITDEAIRAFELPSNPPILITSAKTGENVDAAFLRLGELIGLDG